MFYSIPGGVYNGHGGLILSTSKYIIIFLTVFIRTLHPVPLVIPYGTTLFIVSEM